MDQKTLKERVELANREYGHLGRYPGVFCDSVPMPEIELLPLLNELWARNQEMEAMLLRGFVGTAHIMDHPNGVTVAMTIPGLMGAPRAGTLVFVPAEAQ